MATEYQRMLDGTRAPIEKEITDFIGEPAKGAWVKLRRFLKENYDIEPEMIFDKEHGWDVRYRKSGKTLITLTPEKGAVRILIVLGREESEKARAPWKELFSTGYNFSATSKVVVTFFSLLRCRASLDNCVVDYIVFQKQIRVL